VIGLLATGLLAAGCGGAADEPATAPPTTTVAAPTTPARTTPPRAPTRTAAAETVDADCPYVEATVIAETVGQRIARSTVTRTKPHVGCAFYRPDGEKAADIAVSVLADSTAARARALALAGPTADPVDTVGDGGAVAVTDRSTLLAVTQGPALVVVRINQSSSLEAVEIAKLVVAGI